MAQFLVAYGGRKTVERERVSPLSALTIWLSLSLALWFGIWLALCAVFGG